MIAVKMVFVKFFGGGGTAPRPPVATWVQRVNDYAPHLQ